MSRDRVEQIAARWEKVPRGEPWTPELTELLCYFEDEGEPRVWNWDVTGRAIAAAPDDIAWLIAEVRWLRAEVARQNPTSDPRAPLKSSSGSDLTPRAGYASSGGPTEGQT